MRIGKSIVLGCAAVIAAASIAPAQERTVARVSWLAGCWEGTVAGAVYEEVWLAPRGSTMVGVSRTTRDDRTTGFEFLRIVEERGGLHYLAAPSSQQPARFTATAVGGDGVVFENPEHDFPQRIAYRRIGVDSLFARVDGATAAGTRALEFALARVPCPGR